MKKIDKIWISLVLIATLVSCVEHEVLDYDVEKPVSVAAQEEINAYDALISYIDRSANAQFRLGMGVTPGDYASGGVITRLINSNFDEIVPTTGISHGDLVGEDGNLNASNAVNFYENSDNADVPIHSSALIHHQGQSAVYLNSTIAPTIIPAQGGPAWEVLSSQDFETDDASNYLTNGENAVLSFTADGGGSDGTGRALVVSNGEVRANDWESQLFFTFSPATLEGEQFQLTMDVRADADVTMATQAQTEPYAYKHWDFFGAINAGSEWTTITVPITVSAETSECTTIAFNLGNVATNYYFDNITVARFNENAGGPTWDLLSGNDFETDDASNYLTNGANAVLSFTADGEGANGVGRALVVTNGEVRPNDWESQLFFTFAPASVEGEQLRLTMDVRADAAATMATQAQTEPYAYKHWNFFGAINATTEWSQIEVVITVSPETSECTTIAFNLGNVATSYYFDNIEVRWYNEEGGGEQIIEKTPQEKVDTLSFAMETWISGIMQSAAEYNVSAWDVIANPMDDVNPTELMSGGAEQAEGEFYWQDYLGLDYGVKAFTLARQFAGEGTLLFITDNNLESNLDKCDGLISYVEYIEDQGATVDGIGAQMNIDLDTDMAGITTMFEKLAATGKQIRIAQLSVSINTDVTEESLQEQSDMYKYVVDQYREQVPAAQRYGITLWGAVGPDGIWYAGDQNYLRKPAYQGFADGLEEMR